MRKIAFLLVLSLLLVSPALAQSGALAYGSNTLGTLSADAPLAFFTFNGTAGDLVSIQVIGIGIDPAVSLNSPAQQQLANNDNESPGTTDARINLSLPQTGIFTVLVSSVTGAPGDFLLRLNGQAAPLTTALTDVPVDANIAPESPQWFSFSASPTEIITLNVTTAAVDFGFRVIVRDVDGNLVALVSGSDIVGVSLPFPPGSEVYTVEITAYDAPGQVSIFIGGPAAAAHAVPEPVQTEEAAPPPVLPAGACGVSPGQGIVNVRAGAGTSFGIIGQLRPSQVLEVTGRLNDWYQVIVPNVGTGWVSSTVVFTTGDCRAVPQLEGGQAPPPVETEEVDQPTATYTPSATPTIDGQPTATYTPTYTPTTHQDQQGSTPTYTPTATPTAPVPTAPPDANFNSPLNIPLDSNVSVTDFVSYPDGDREDMVRWDISGMNANSALSGGRARLVISASCFGTGTHQVRFFTGGQTFNCGQTLIDREVTADSRTGQFTITAIGGEGTYVQWVLAGSATRTN